MESQNNPPTNYVDRLIGGQISNSVEYGKFAFPGRTDYEKYFINNGAIQTPEELWQRDDLLAQVQRHWHSRGQNGCVFAQAIASKAEDRGWKVAVINKQVVSLFEKNEIDHIDSKIQEAIIDPESQIQSLLFPQVTQSRELVDLVKAVTLTESIFISKETNFNELTTIALRIAINEDGVLSWLMGFGPFNYFPSTRQAPMTEIAIRVKPKPDKIFPKLNQDREAAHLADTPIYMEDCVSERLWQSTYEKTRNILGGDPDHFSAAKVTLSLPRELWIVK